MKKTKKTLISIVSSLLIATTMLPMAACDKDGGKNGVTIQEVVAYDGSEVEISFYHTMGANLQAVLNKYIPEFNKMYPNITIKHDSMGDYDGAREQIATEISGGNSPNIAYCYPDHIALYNKAKKVVQLDHYIACDKIVTKDDGTTEIMGLTQEQKDDFIKAFYDEGSVYGDGYTYTLPMAKSTEVMFYNKTYFEENKLTVPTTWDEMEDVCKKIKDNEGANVVPLGYDSEANWFITMTEQLNTPYTSNEGDSHYLFNTKENRDFVQRFTEWYQKGYVTTKEISGSYTSNLFTQTAADKMRCIMCVGSSGGASYQSSNVDATGKAEFEVGVTMIPQANTENPKVIQQGPSLCIFKKSNAQEVAASWLFVKFLTTNVKFQAQFSQTSGYMPVIKSAQNDPVYQEWLSPTDGTAADLKATCVKQALAQMDYYYVSPAFEGSSAARDEVGKLLQTCFTKMPKDDTAAAFIEKEFKNTVDTLLYDYDD